MKNIFSFWSSSIVLLLAVHPSEHSPCRRDTLYLEIAAEMLSKAREQAPAMDCEQVLRNGYNVSGVYTIWPVSRLIEDKLEVYCDMHTDGGGWTVLQRRGNFNRSIDYFYRKWRSYKRGFGDLQKDFWLGNDNIFALTNQRLYSVRFDMAAVGGEKRYALYDMFWIDSESNNYTLHIKDYSGNAGDSMTDKHDGQKFSTRDRKNDNYKESCAVMYKGAWWYNSCHESNLNGLYRRGAHGSFADGVNWKSWKGYKESLDRSEIKIRPKNFRRRDINKNEANSGNGIPNDDEDFQLDADRYTNSRG